MTAKKIKTPKRRWKPTIGAKLGPQEQKIVDALKSGAVTVPTLYRILMPNAVKVPLRVQQQKIGGVAARYNKKRRSPRIVPGPTGSYRLRRVR